MSTDDLSQIQSVYAATSVEAQEAAYDAWAQEYERDLWATGYSIPGQVAALFARFVDPSDGPFLDAGCGTGMQLEPLAAAGYGGFTGLDLSVGMLKVAEAKGTYDRLVQGALGERLPFDDNAFAATLTCGTITQGHAPPESFRDLIRVTRPGGFIIFTLRCDEGIDPAYNAILRTLARESLWTQIYEGPPKPTMPYSEPEVQHKGWVFEVRKG